MNLYQKLWEKLSAPCPAMHALVFAYACRCYQSLYG